MASGPNEKPFLYIRLGMGTDQQNLLERQRLVSEYALACTIPQNPRRGFSQRGRLSHPDYVPADMLQPEICISRMPWVLAVQSK